MTQGQPPNIVGVSPVSLGVIFSCGLLLVGSRLVFHALELVVLSCAQCVREQTQS